MLALLIALLAMPAQAATRSGLAFRVSCTGFNILGGSITLDRDNTGAGRERFSMVATDGGGKTLYAGPVESFWVGGSVTFPTGASIDFSDVAEANPITVALVSDAGNGLDAQVVYAASGTCSSLATAEAAFVSPGGVTSPSIPLNSVPDLSSSSDAAIAAAPGYLVVNTGYLNLRSGDGPEYTIVGRAAGGAKLLALGRNANFTWWYVQAGDVVGWTLAELLVARGDLTDVPVVVPQGEIALPRLFLYRAATLTATPGGAPVCDVAGNLEYEITARTAGATFVKVNAECGSGWLAVALGAIRNPASLAIPVE
jgi:hypothetical protein